MGNSPERPPQKAAGKHLKRLTILHSNDMHGDFLAERVDQKLIGGVSMLSGYVNRVRSQEKNVIYAIAGDMFRGSVIDAEYKGMSTIEIMNLLAPDVVTIGNHEIDYGIAHLLFIEKCARFPIINANLYIKGSHARLFRSHCVLRRDGMKVLFIGVITEAILAEARKDELIGTLVDINDAAVEIRRIVNSCKSADVDLTVLLTHIGIEADKRLAAALDPALGIDLIIGGHSHTLMDAPLMVNGIPIVQVGMGTNQIGRFDILVDTDKNAIHSYTWQCVPIDEAHCPRDRELEALIRHYKERVDEKYGRIITRFSRSLSHPLRNRETELGDLFSEAIRDSLGLDIMLYGSGGIRVDKLGPTLRYGDLMEAVPYDDAVFMLRLRGTQVRQVMAYLLREDAFLGCTEFYQLSAGLRLVYDRAARRIRSLTLNGRPLGEKKLYSVGLQHFHLTNMESYLGLSREAAEENGPIKRVSSSCRDVLEAYFLSHNHLDQRIEGRIEIIGD